MIKNFKNHREGIYTLLSKYLEHIEIKSYYGVDMLLVSLLMVQLIYHLRNAYGDTQTKDQCDHYLKEYAKVKFEFERYLLCFLDKNFMDTNRNNFYFALCR